MKPTIMRGKKKKKPTKTIMQMPDRNQLPYGHK